MFQNKFKHLNVDSRRKIKIMKTEKKTAQSR